MTSRIFNFYTSSFEKDSGTNHNANYLLIGQQICQGVGINVILLIHHLLKII